MKRKWDVSSDEIRKKCVDEIIARLDDQGPETGLITAEDIIDIVAQNIGPDIYNLAIKDATKLINERLSDLETDLDLLQNQS